MAYRLAGFNGERPDAITRHFHVGNGYRAYGPQLRRFTTPDNWSPFGEGGINPFSYCAGDTVNQADPSGHLSVGQWAGMGLGMVAGFVLSVITDGAALPVIASLLATMAGEAAIGAGTELLAEAVDGQRINWKQVGIAAGIGATATLAGYGLGQVRRFAGRGKRAFGSLMMEGQETRVAEQSSPVIAGAAGGTQESPTQRALDFIQNPNKFRHISFDDYITSEDLINNQPGKRNYFTNEYMRDAWIFKENYRPVRDVPYYASDIVKYQYKEVSTRNGFHGVMPQKIISESVCNKETLDMTRGKKDQDLFNAFFETPNGKSTKRILNEFGLHASVVSQTWSGEGMDFTVDVAVAP